MAEQTDSKAKCKCKCSIRWIPTSTNALSEAEDRLLSGLTSNIQKRFISVKSGDANLWTLTVNNVDNLDSAATACPLVMLHGFGGGAGLWAGNLDALAKDRTVHAIDLLGFGQSSRVSFDSGDEVAEEEFIDSIEDWRKVMGLSEFILLGHSFGAYLATCYALKFPQYLRHLLLIDPWGFPFSPSQEELEEKLPPRYRIAASILKHFNPLASVRASGPLGPKLVRRMRPDLADKFAKVTGNDEEAIFDYIYHCNAQEPTGEAAFKSISHLLGWAKRPMVSRIGYLSVDLPISFIYGANSWMDSEVAFHIRDGIRGNSVVTIDIIKNASHHVYADQTEEFNKHVQRICSVADKKGYNKD